MTPDRKRKTLKDLVPPFELCKLIPYRKFCNTHFVWTHGIVTLRPTFRYRGMKPAPTLSEILRELIAEGVKTTEIYYLCSKKREVWHIFAEEKEPTSDEVIERAALRFWLKVHGIEVPK